MSATYAGRLKRLEDLLRKRPLTAKAAAAVLGCCKPTIYTQILALKELGVDVVEVRGSTGRPGPSPIAYGVR